MAFDGSVLIPLFACCLPVGIIYVRGHFRLREKELELQAHKGLPLLEGGPQEAQREKKAMEARIQNLESIVCSVDFELNQRLNRLAAESSLAMKPLPAGSALPALTPAKEAAAVTEATAYGLGRLVPGQVIMGRYSVERELGHGGMGAVYLARDAKLGERVALKTISALTVGDPAALSERIRREVQAARKITHPNVIRIHDLHDEGPLLFLSMEYIEGETLWARVRRLGPLSIAETRQVLADVAAGVAAAHGAGVVHRDLKPQNVLLSGNSVKVIDFGLAQAASLGGTTGTGIILGTPEYMAPEQVRGGRIDARTDVYALGAMAYYVVTGRPPFEGDTPIAVAFAQVQEAPRSLRELRPEVPADLDAAILRALSKDPAARMPDASEWRRVLSA